MLRVQRISRLAAAVAALALTGAAHAAIVPITTLYNTGVIANNPTTGVPSSLVTTTVGADLGTNPDSHWTITSVPSGFSGQTVPFAANVVSTNDGDDVEGTFPNYPFSPGVWQLDSDSLSEWIAPHTDEGDVGNEASSTTQFYTYETTFSLAGLNPATASITGTYTEDDILVNVFLNGTGLGISQGGNNTSSIGSHTFSIPVGSSFVAGTNTLDFVVENFPITGSGNNPTGLRVEMTGTDTSVPEPVGVSFLALSLLGLRRRRRVAK